jgi:hypothetical protein
MLIVDVVLLIVGAALLFAVNPRILRRIAAVATWAVVAGLIVLALNGFPLMRKRVGRPHLALAPPTDSRALSVHRYVGFATESLFSFAWPSLLGLVFRVPISRLRRTVVVIAATLLLFAFSIVAISAYMLPRVGSVALPTPLAATILRFAIVHVTFGPALAALLLIILAFSALREPRVAAG